MKKVSFNKMLSEAELCDVLREASIKERGVMMTFHMMLMGTMFIMMFIILQWLIGQHMAMTMSPPISGDHAKARMMAVNIASLIVAGVSIFALSLMSKTPLTYMIFGAKVVDARTLSDISRGQATLRCVIKTLAVIFSPLALFYLIKNGNVNIVDSITQTRVLVLERRLEVCDTERSSDESDIPASS